MDFFANLLAAMAGLLVGAAGAGYKVRQRRDPKAVELERKFQEQTAAMRSLELELARVVSDSEAAALARAQAEEEARIEPETLAVITAAVTVALRKRVRITSARLAQPEQSWSHQGRVVVQSSHNLNGRR